MNRIIKFRAWHMKAEKMFSPEEMAEDQLTIMPDGKGFINVDSHSTRNSQFIDSMVPMQFTGVLDYTGREIFEGDIVRSTTGYFGVIRYGLGFFHWNGEPLVEEDDDRLNWGKVVGNIYEQEYLLK